MFDTTFLKKKFLRFIFNKTNSCIVQKKDVVGAYDSRKTFMLLIRWKRVLIIFWYIIINVSINL